MEAVVTASPAGAAETSGIWTPSRARSELPGRLGREVRRRRRACRRRSTGRCRGRRRSPAGSTWKPCAWPCRSSRSCDVAKPRGSAREELLEGSRVEPPARRVEPRQELPGDRLLRSLPPPEAAPSALPRLAPREQQLHPHPLREHDLLAPRVVAQRRQNARPRSSSPPGRRSAAAARDPATRAGARTPAAPGGRRAPSRPARPASPPCRAPPGTRPGKPTWSSARTPPSWTRRPTTASTSARRKGSAGACGSCGKSKPGTKTRTLPEARLHPTGGARRSRPSGARASPSASRARRRPATRPRDPRAACR